MMPASIHGSISSAISYPVARSSAKPIARPAGPIGPIRTPSPTPVAKPSSAPAQTPPQGYRGVNAGRQSRFDQRSARRWGDWGILGVPGYMLWLENDCLLATGDPFACAAAPINNLWP